MSLIKGTINIIYNDATLFDVINTKIHEFNILDNKSQYNEYRNKKNIIISFNLHNKEHLYDLMDTTIMYNKVDRDLICGGVKILSSYDSRIPLYFEIINNAYFNYNDDDEIKEKLKTIYSNNIRNETDMSLYNCIFCKKNRSTDIVFLIRKLKHGIDTHRYFFSFDSNHFTPDQIQILLNYIFLKDI